MQDTQLISSKEALKILDLSNYRYLNYLYKRGLVKRVVKGPRMIRYIKSDLESLNSRVITDGIILTSKPNGIK